MQILLRFNSKLVRLEVKTLLATAYRLWFQFQTGSIRSLQRLTEKTNAYLFQFQTGSIRSLYSQP